jgi:hypothetical protein
MGETLENRAGGYLSRRQFLTSTVGAPVAYALGEPLFAQDAPKPADLTDYFKRKERTAAPSPLEVQGATEVYLKSSLKADYEKAKTPEGKKALVAELLKIASGEQNAANKFALYHEARDHSAALGAFDSTSEAVNGLYNTFDIKLTDALNGLADKITKNLSKDGLNAFVGMYVKLAEKAVGENDYDSAVAAVKFASGKTSADKELVARAKKLSEQIPFLKGEYETAYNAAIGFGNLNDPKTSHALGSYLCFVKGAWEPGLPYLANSNDGIIKLIANLEKGKPADAKDQFRLGNSWYEHAKRAKKDSVDQDRFTGRAEYWLKTAAQTATGLLKKDIETKLAEIEKSSAGSAVGAAGGIDLLAFTDPKKDKANGEWKRDKGNSIVLEKSDGTLKIPYEPPPQYDLEMTLEVIGGSGWTAIGLIKDKSRFVAVIDAVASGYVTGFEAIDGKSAAANETTYKGQVLKLNKPSNIVLSVRDSGATLTIDGQKKSEYRGPYSKLNYSGGYAPAGHNGLYLTFLNTGARITKMQLTPISGQGKRLQ